MKKISYILIGVFVILILFIGSFISFILYYSYQSIDYATNEDIDVTLSPNPIYLNNFTGPNYFEVELMNTANEKKRITTSQYEYLGGTFECTAIANYTSYRYITFYYNHNRDETNETDDILDPGESYTFTTCMRFDWFYYYNNSNDYDIEKELIDENPDHFFFYITIRIYNTYADSDKVAVIRSH